MRSKPHMNWRSRKVGHVTVSVSPKPKSPYTVLRVETMIDTGRGKPQMVLGNAFPEYWQIDLDEPLNGKNHQPLPCRIGGINCVYTGRAFGVVTDVTDALYALTGNAKLAAITPDVMAPGDFVIFKHAAPDYKIRLAGVVRAVKSRAEKQNKI